MRDSALINAIRRHIIASATEDELIEAGVIEYVGHVRRNIHTGRYVFRDHPPRPDVPGPPPMPEDPAYRIVAPWRRKGVGNKARHAARPATT